MYALTKIKTFNGHEGQGLNAVITKNGQPVAFVLDDANGGEMEIDFTNPLQNAASYNKHKDTAAAEEAAFVAWCKNWYETSPEAAASREQDAKMKQTYSDWTPDYDGDWINTTVDALQNKKRFDRAAKTKTLFQIEGDKPEEWRTLKSPYSPDVQKWLDQKYGAKVTHIWGVK